MALCRFLTGSDLGWLAHGMTEEDIPNEHPGLEKEDFAFLYTFAADAADAATAIIDVC